MPNQSQDSGSAINAGNPRPVAVDLFAGAGGLSLGLEQAGFDVAVAVEYDPVHAATHEFNFPRTKVLCADVSALEPKVLRAAVRSGITAHGRGADQWNGEIDLIAGGPVEAAHWFDAAPALYQQTPAA